jgi:hypothetical protein
MLQHQLLFQLSSAIFFYQNIFFVDSFYIILNIYKHSYLFEGEGEGVGVRIRRKHPCSHHQIQSIGLGLLCMKCPIIWDINKKTMSIVIIGKLILLNDVLSMIEAN